MTLAQHYQYQQGFLNEEAYANLRNVLKQFGPMWKQFGVIPPRKSFQAEIDEILETDQQPL